MRKGPKSEAGSRFAAANRRLILKKASKHPYEKESDMKNKVREIIKSLQEMEIHGSE